MKSEKSIGILLIVLILLIAAFLRFYKLEDYMTYLGDEGRDSLVMKRILVDHDFPLLGPPTSVGNMYLGPLYYYMMSIPSAIFWLEPVAAAGMNALIGVLTVYLIFYLSKEWFGFKSGLLASFAYAISPITIIYSRFSWNPNPAPFFALLSIIGLNQIRKTKDFKLFILTSGSLAFALQMHYLALILVPVVLILYLYLILQNQKRYVWVGTILGVLVFLLLMSPLLIFDLKYNYLNSRSLLELVSSKDSSVEFSFFNNLVKIVPLYGYNLITRYIGGQNILVGSTLSLILLIPVGLFIYNLRKKTFSWPLFVMLVWIIVGILGLSFYKQEVYDHYLGFLNPAPYLLLAGVVFFLPSRVSWYGVSALGLIIAITNLPRNPLLKPPNMQLFRTQEIAKYIIAKSENKSFNFALIAERNYDSAYQFFLYKYNHTPAMLPAEVADQLFVVCEDKVCNPTTHQKFEISGFGMSKVVDVEEILGVKVFKLIHNPSGEPT